MSTNATVLSLMPGDLSILALMIVSVATRLLLGAWLVASGWNKQQHWLRWWQALEGYRWMPGAAKRPVAALLPSVEIGLGIALCLPLVPTLSAALCSLLMLAFAVMLSGNLLAGITRFDCGCTPGRRSPHAGWLLLRALALALLSAGLALLPLPHWTLWLPVALTLALALLLLLSWRTLRTAGRPSTWSPRY